MLNVVAPSYLLLALLNLPGAAVVSGQNPAGLVSCRSWDGFRGGLDCRSLRPRGHRVRRRLAGVRKLG
jgi:hypothetical protein